MRWTTLLGGGLVAALPLAFLISQVMDTAGKRVGSMMVENGLDDHAHRLKDADSDISAMVARELGEKSVVEGEIDFANPTAEDVRFLLGLLSTGNPEQRRSAARGLSEIGDPRFVRPLLINADEGGNPEAEPLFYCLAALEILRFRTRAEAAEWLLDTLEDTSLEIAPACRQELGDKLSLIGVDDPDVLRELLMSERPRVVLYALERMPKGTGPDTMAAVEALRLSPNEAVRNGAEAWISED